MDIRLASVVTGASDGRLYEHVGVRDETAREGVRRGFVIHVGRDRNLLVVWDDDDSTSVVTPDALVDLRTPRNA